MSFEWPIRVYIEDTDMGGIVYYVNYLKFMERARTEFLRSVGVAQNDLKSEGYLFVVKSVQCDYKKPAQLDDQLTVSVQVKSCRAAGVTFKQQIRHQNSILCEALVEVVCVSCASMKPLRFPAQLKKFLMADIT